MTIRRFLAGSILFCALAVPLADSCFAVEASAALSSIPFKREPSATASEGPRLLIGFGFCAALLVGAIYLTRRRNGFPGRGTAGKRLAQVIETSRLGPKTVLYVVEFGENRYLLAESVNGVHCVATAPLLQHASEPPQ